ncbi:MAG: ketoacyl-ACP synthase III [Proteobacteria bacterium]|nr:ketoacyl-ACP synthase III [Pseudomonadota bacterium]
MSGTGMCVPDRVVTNLELAERMNTTDEWIRQRTGIVERRHVVDGETPGGLGTKAALNAMARAKCRVDDIDLLLVATLSPEHYFPGTASFIQRSLGMGTKPSMDIRAQCSGFIYGLSVANSLIVSGQYKRILLVAVEVQSRGLDFSDRGRDMAALFGDGAGAVVVEASKSPEHGFMNIVLKSEGEHAERLWVEYPSMASTPHCPASAIEEGRIYPKMDGKFVFKSAVARLPEVIQESLEPLHLSPRDIDTFVFHQANLRINEFVANSFGLPAQKFPYNIDRYGNCSSASIPILLDECVRNGAMSRGNLVCFAAFGSGFTWGSAVMRWS